jgi:hypothetical protein
MREFAISSSSALLAKVSFNLTLCTQTMLNNYIKLLIFKLANLITCPDGLVFSEKTGTCSWPGEANRVGCQSSGTLL